MKALTCVLVATFLCAAAFAQEKDDPREGEVRALRAEVELYRKTADARLEEIKTLKAELEILKKEIEVLRGPAAAPGPEAWYHGHPRTAAWFDAMYAQFNDKIAYVNGKYLDIEACRMANLAVEEEPPTAGKEFRIPEVGSKVFQVLGKNEVLIHQPGALTALGGGQGRTPALTFHVKGMDAAGFIDGQRLPEKTVKVGTTSYTRGELELVYVGNYTYKTATRINTVQSFVAYQPLTREQFADALTKGLELVTYKLVQIDYEKRQPGWLILETMRPAAEAEKKRKPAGPMEPPWAPVYYRVVGEPAGGN
jgi:hypothetical protein